MLTLCPPPKVADATAFDRLGARAVLESTPYMHMPYDDADAAEHGFWKA